MFFYTNMGPRGRRTGHGGFLPGILLGVFGLMFGGWIVLAVLGVFLGIFAAVAGPLVGIFASCFSWIYHTVFSGSGFALGIVIGLIWYFSRKNRNTSSRNDEEDYDEEEYTETRHYNSYGA